MADYKNQHFVTEAYLKAWLDPKSPQGAYVWVTSKTKKKLFKKSPRKLFSEEDFYTVYDVEGNRILELEHKLKEIEDKFILLRDNKLRDHLSLNPEDRKTIALFASTMYARTKRQKEERASKFGKITLFLLSRSLRNYPPSSNKQKNISTLTN